MASEAAVNASASPTEAAVQASKGIQSGLFEELQLAAAILLIYQPLIPLSFCLHLDNYYHKLVDVSFFNFCQLVSSNLQEYGCRTQVVIVSCVLPPYGKEKGITK